MNSLIGTISTGFVEFYEKIEFIYISFIYLNLIKYYLLKIT